LTRARAERAVGRRRASRDAAAAHLVLRWLGPDFHRGAVARIRGLLEVPGGPSAEGRVLVELVDATVLPGAPGLAAAFERYVALLEASGRAEEALAAIGALLRRLESFDSFSEGCDLALSVGRLSGKLARWDRAAAVF